MVEKEKIIAGRRLPIFILIGVAVVVIWQIFGIICNMKYKNFAITEKDFAGFKPRLENWRIEKVSIGSSSTDPNIIGFKYYNSNMTVFVRLVHGYNMCECMKLKGYKVSLIADTRTNITERSGGMMQIWRLISPANDNAIWITGVLGGRNMVQTDKDIRSFIFPRGGNVAGLPDSTGISLESVRHPVSNTTQHVKYKWTDSRGDVLIFLGLKKLPWASDDYLSLVVQWEGSDVKPEQEPAVIAMLESIYRNMAESLGEHAALQKKQR